jgi:large subunit ribosomal protein L25
MALQAIKHFRQREIVAALRNATSSPQVHTKEVVTAYNPFLPRLNTESGRWAPAKYSLRRQAELVKKAKESGTLHLLPPGPKLSVKELQVAKSAAKAGPSIEVESVRVLNKGETWKQEVQWEGEVKERNVPGADVGNRLYAGKWRMFKGHKWQRVMEKTLEKREKAMKVMGRRIKSFKTVCSFLSGT